MLRVTLRLSIPAFWIGLVTPTVPAFSADVALINSWLSFGQIRPLKDRVDQPKQDCPAARSLQDCRKTDREKT
jgi:hypothetical protein